MSADIPILAAFLAGMVSIASPCVLPLVPIYLAHLAGVSVGQGDPIARRSVLANAAAYVAGFSIVFILLGVALGAAGVLVDTGSLVAGNRFWLVRIGGALLIVFGLHQLGLIRIPVLERERRISTGGLPAGQLTSSFVIGMTFGAGWSPCVGPILGAILTMAAGQGSIEKAGLLLAVYAAGLGVPFMLAAIAWGSSPAIIHAINRHLGLVTSVSGGVMLAIGSIMVLGLYQQFFARLVAMAPWIPWEPGL